MYGTLYPFFNLSTEKVYFFSKKTALFLSFNKNNAGIFIK